MLKGGQNTASVAPRGIHISTQVYGKAVKLLYGTTKITPDLIWYNDWKAGKNPTNPAQWTVVGGQQGGKKKSGSKKSGSQISYYSAALDLLVGHAPVLGALSIWYNNQKLEVKVCSASGYVSGNSFSFTPVAGESLVTVTITAGGTYSAPGFVSDGQSSQNNTGVYDNTLGIWLAAADPTTSPGPNQYTVNNSGLYTFNSTQSGHSLGVHYRKTGTGTAGIVAAILAVTVNEPLPTTTFSDYGAPASVTYAGHWNRPLWNRAFGLPGRIDATANTGRDPYSFNWPGGATVNFPSTALNGKPVTVYYGVPIIDKSDGTFYSSSITPLALLNLEFEAACGSGSEYVNHTAQQDVNPWCAGIGSTKFDLGTANAIPNLQIEVQGAFAVWPNGDAHVADVITDIVMSGPCGVNAAITIPHGVNCNAYNNGGYLAPLWPPGNGLLLGAVGSDGIPAGLAAMHAWCVANGISVSLNQDSQRSAIDLLKELAAVGNSAPVYTGDTLTLIPYDEVSNVANGAIYTAPTSSGPVFDFTDQDFVKSPKNPPIICTRKRRADCDNVVSVEFVQRDLDYMGCVVTQTDEYSVARFGPRKGGQPTSVGMGLPSGSTSMKSIADETVAHLTAAIMVKRSAYGVDTYEFEVKAENIGLVAMDMGTITDVKLGIIKVPVRLTQVEETSKNTLKCTAERYVYGLSHPSIAGLPLVSGSLVSGSGDPGVPNAPFIIEPTWTVAGNPQLLFAVSGSDPNYGGCIVNVSIDGGVSYDPIGSCAPGTTGYLTAAFGISSDPDTTDTLSVDLTESAGVLTSESQQVADGFLNPLLVAIESGSPLAIVDFEEVCPTTAVLTSAYHYNLTTYIRRACNGSTSASHPSGNRIAALDSATLSVDRDPVWLLKNLYFKFQAFNKIGGMINPLPSCPVYSFTPSRTVFPGTPLASDPTKAISVGLLNPSFENGDEGWTKGGGWSIISTGSPWNGSWCAAHSGSTASGIDNQWINPAAPGQVWAASCMVNPNGQGGTGYVIISFRDASNATLANVFGSGVAGGSSYVMSRAFGTAPAGTDHVVIAGYIASPSGAGNWYFDFFDIVQGPSTTDEVPGGVNTTTVPTVIGGANLLSNGDFEYGSAANNVPGWTNFRGTGAGSTIGFGGGYTGTRSLQLNPCSPGPPAVQFNQTFQVTPGDEYQLSAAIWLQNVATQGAVIVQFYNASRAFLSQVLIVAPSVGWQFQTLDVAVPSSAKFMQVVCATGGSNPNGYSVAFDAVGLYKYAQYGTGATPGVTVGSLQPAQAGADVTGLNTAAAIAGQGALATWSYGGTLISQTKNGLIAVAWGANLVPNPGFESNLVGCPTNTPISSGSPVGDNWTFNDGLGICYGALNTSRTKSGKLSGQIVLPPGVNVPAGGLSAYMSAEAHLPLKIGDIVRISGWYAWDASAAFPSWGASSYVYVGLVLFDGSNTAIGGLTAASAADPVNSSMVQVQAAVTITDPTVSYAVPVCVLIVANTSGVSQSTGSNTYAAVSFDDISMTKQQTAYDLTPLNTLYTNTSTSNLLNQSGTSTTINVSAFTNQYGDGQVSYNSGSVNPGAYGTYFVYCIDPTYTGGAVAYLYTQDASNLTAQNGVIFVGKITTSGGGGGSGGTGGGGTNGNCFTSGVLLRTPDGPRAISSIQPGDMVNTKNGPRPVAKVLQHAYAGPLCSLSDGEWVTPGHEFFVRQQWRRADSFLAVTVTDFDGVVWNLHIDSPDEDDWNYVLETDGLIAHNFLKA